MNLRRRAKLVKPVKLAMKNKIIWKNIGETPLEALERFRSDQADLANVPMTYAGRLDPMASGVLLILIGDECKKKEEYLGLDKVYEVELCFGIETDTYDALGIASDPVCIDEALQVKIENVIRDFIAQVPITFSQEYPPFSSRAVGGRQLHERARANDLPDEMPVKNVTIYSVEILEKSMVDSALMIEKILRDIDKVKGDFRQDEIRARWKAILGAKATKLFVIRLKIKCSSGTYMRSLAHMLGKEVGMGAFALSIVRLEISRSDL